jgi:hypothetical protein
MGREAKSKPGGVEQSANRDFSTPSHEGYDVCEYTVIPGMWLLALQDNITVII